MAGIFRRCGMVPAQIPVFLSQNPSTKKSSFRGAVLILAWAPPRCTTSSARQALRSPRVLAALRSRGSAGALTCLRPAVLAVRRAYTHEPAPHMQGEQAHVRGEVVYAEYVDQDLEIQLQPGLVRAFCFGRRTGFPKVPVGPAYRI